jgi:uncharacterized membrane protein
MKIPWTVLAVLALAAYPLLVFNGLHAIGVRPLAIVLLLLLCLRVFAAWHASRQLSGITVWPALLAVIVIVLPALWFDRDDILRFYPVLINAIFLCVFASSLWAEKTVVEKIARLTDKNFPSEAIAYTRNVTLWWCGFFVINGAIALYTAMFASFSSWAFYNGFLSYVFMGAFFSVEFIIRFFFRRRLDIKISQAQAKSGEMP